jgi:subtilisin-like proprotein convertase family protein
MCTSENACIIEALAFGQVIPDGQYNGAQGSMACVELNCAKVGTVKVGQVQVSLDHSWVGDLTMKLFSPGNVKILTVMSMPGFVEPADNGMGTSFESSDLAKSFPLIYRDGGKKDAELMGNTISGSEIVCKDDLACDYFPNKGAAATLGKFSDLVGTASGGVWKFCIGDSQPGDVGKIEKVKLTLILQ